MEPTILYVLALVLVIAGLAGTVVPVLPGVLLVFGGLFLAAFADNFVRVGASPKALLGATLGGAVGFLFGIPGLILGPFLGAALGEYAARGTLRQAGKVGLGTWVGLLVAAVAKVAIAFAMVGTFLAFWALNG